MPAAQLRSLGDLKSLFPVVPTADTLAATQALVIPRITTTVRDALTAAQRPTGTLVYNTTTNKLNLRVAAAWEVVTSA